MQKTMEKNNKLTMLLLFLRDFYHGKEMKNYCQDF